MTEEEREAVERLAQWMLEHSFATGHGDNTDDLLSELSWQVKELRDARQQTAMEIAEWLKPQLIELRRSRSIADGANASFAIREAEVWAEQVAHSIRSRYSPSTSED